MNSPPGVPGPTWATSSFSSSDSMGTLLDADRRRILDVFEVKELPHVVAQDELLLVRGDAGEVHLDRLLGFGPVALGVREVGGPHDLGDADLVPHAHAHRVVHEAP